MGPFTETFYSGQIEMRTAKSNHAEIKRVECMLCNIKKQMYMINRR